MLRGPGQPRRYWQGMRPPGIIPAPIIMAGGLDLMTPPFQMKPGSLRAAQNFECSIFGGYRRIDGYEAFDGQAAPSSMQYWILGATITGSAALNNTLHGATSGATGVIIALPGAKFVLTQVVGTFQSGENLNVGAGTIAVSTSLALAGSASTPKLDGQYLALAANVQRALITTVPGSGPVRGVVYYNDVLYAFRDNAGATAEAIYKSTGAGWTLVALNNTVTFSTGGAVTPAEGATLTQGGVTATVKRVGLQSGTWAGSTAAGILVVTNPSGGNFAAGAATLTGGATVTLAGAQSAIMLSPGGRYDFTVGNLTGATGTKRIYGCDGVNKAFEFDGAVYVPISTGMTTDTPSHCVIHMFHLFLTFGASLQFSAAGFPYQWSPVVGAGELAMGDNITGLSVQSSSAANSALAVFTTGRLSILYGSGASTFSLLPYRDEIGTFPFTNQNLAQTIFLDLQGITDITATQAYGNFVYAVITDQVKSQLNTWRLLATASCVNRNRGQYRLFFSNGYAFYLTMHGSKVVGIMPILFPDVARCAWADKMANGAEVSFFGSDSGYVYQLDSGTSFNGKSLEAFINLAYNFERSPRTLKTYRGGALEVSGSSYIEFNAGYSLGYGSTDTTQPGTVLTAQSFRSVLWDQSVWDSFFFDGQTLSPSTLELGGDAENISLSIYSNSDAFQSFTLTGGIINYTPRRELR